MNVWCILLPSLLVPPLSEALKLKNWIANTEKISVRSRSGWHFQTFCTHWNFSDLAHKKARSLGCGSHVRSRRNKPSCRSCGHTLAYAEGHQLYTGGRWLPGFYSGIAECLPASIQLKNETPAEDEPRKGGTRKARSWMHHMRTPCASLKKEK